MKVCSPPEFFHKNMSHEQSLFTWSTFRDSSMSAKLKYFWKAYERKESNADIENQLNNLLPNIIHTINIFVMLTYAVWGLGCKMFTKLRFQRCTKKSSQFQAIKCVQAKNDVQWCTKKSNQFQATKYVQVKNYVQRCTKKSSQFQAIKYVQAKNDVQWCTKKSSQFQAIKYVQPKKTMCSDAPKNLAGFKQQSMCKKKRCAAMHQKI